MTAPTRAGQARKLTSAGEVLGSTYRGPFAGADVCKEAGLALNPGASRPVFEDDVWTLDYANAPSYVSAYEKRLDFTAILNPAWRLVAKELCLALLAPHHEHVAALPNAFRKPVAPNTCSGLIRHLVKWLNFLTENGVDQLSDVTQDHCDTYLQVRSVKADGSGAMTPGSTGDAITCVSYLALYTELFTTDSYQRGFFPWNGRPVSKVIGRDYSLANSTPPVPDEVFQPMLAAALYVVNVLGPYAVDLLEDARRRRAPKGVVNSRGPRFRSRIVQELQRRMDEGHPLPRVTPDRVQQRLKLGWSPDDPLLEISTGRIANGVGYLDIPRPEMEEIRPALTEAVRVLGTEYELGRNAVAVPRHDDPTMFVPWTEPLHHYRASTLQSVVVSACLLVTAALSGMRHCELIELTGSSCLPPAPISGGGQRFKLAGRLVKRQKVGEIVRDEWVVIEDAYRAVELAIRLTGAGDQNTVFKVRRVDEAHDRLRTWVNGPDGQRLGLSPIPDGPVNGRMLRRTLALALAHRPGGLLAAKIHLKHVSVVTTEGYAHKPGGAQAVFLAEVQEAEREHHLELTVAAFRDFQEGRMPAGPGARALIDAFEHIDAELRDHTAGEAKVLDGDERLVNLLRQQSQHLHRGAANYCWFRDPAKALCLKLAGTPDAAQPLAGMCDSGRCPQATHHDVHRPVWAASADALRATIERIPRTQKAARLRVQADLDRDLRVLDEIDKATMAGKEDR